MSRVKRLLAAIVTATVLLTTVPSNFVVKADTVISSTQTTSSSNATFTLKNDTLQIKAGSNVMDLQACSSEILKVNYKPNGKESEDTLVLDPDRRWDTGNIISYDLEADPIVLKTSKMIVKIGKSDLSISVYDASNGLLVKQSSLPNNSSVTLNHNSGQNFYGISAEGNTFVNDSTIRTGNTNVSAGSQGHAGAPFAWTTSGYGILVDSDGGSIDIGDNYFSYKGISKEDTEYYVLVGNPTEILEAQAKVSGTSPMFPKWATGFTNTQWGWPEEQGTAEEQLKKVIDTYRAKEIPIDNFCLDFDWKLWGTGDDYGEFKWNGHNFPSAPSGNLKSYMDERGVKLTGIVKPRLFTGTQEEADMVANGWWYEKTGVIEDYCAKKPVKQVDFSKVGLREWWWKQSQQAFDLGIIGFWNDEVDIDNGFGNFDGLNMQRAIYEGQTAYTSSQRVWSINRNYYTGAQRYAYGLWSGDIKTGFESMKLHKNKLLAATNLGEAKWGMDTGGFIGTPTDENYTRWIQFSAFTPIFRVHGQDITQGNKVRYPWAYGEKAEAASKSVMQLRYKLIPYIYKYDNQAYESGVGLIKSLAVEYPNDPNTASYTDAWMFGDYLLVSPVLDQGQTTKSIYLPKGTWIDYFKGTVYNGGQTISYDTDAVNWSDVPLFIKQGAIIPSQDYENYVDEKEMPNIYVDAFPDVKATTFDYYDDDGNTTSYKDDNYFKQSFKLSRNDDWTGAVFTTSDKEGSYNSDVRYYIVKMHVESNGIPTVNGKSVSKYNSLDSLKSASGEGYAVGTDIYGDVVYVKIAAGKSKTVEVPCEFGESEEETANIYGRSLDSTGSLQYSLDGGSTWSNKASMSTSNDISGYLRGTISYKVSSSIPVRVRFSDEDGYKPSSKGIELPESDSDIFTINKDGTISVGKPGLQSTNIYFETDTSVESVIFEYKDENSSWSDEILITPYLETAGHFYTSLSYPLDVKSNTIRYSIDGGDTWLPSASGQSIATGDYKNSNNGKLVSGKYEWDNSVVVYYNYKTGYAAPYIHWRATGGTWTAAPGTLMESCEYEGYKKAVLNIKDALTAEVCFTNGSGSWDNNGGPNYTFNAGVLTFDKGKVTKGQPNVTKILSVTANVQGGNFTSEQSITLIPSIEGAAVYYTLDGSTPTKSSKKYTTPIKISETTTLKAIAVDSTGSSGVYTQKYVFVDPTEDCTIYFQKPSGWKNTVNAYIYNEENGNLRKVAAWPGVAMISEGNDLYSYTLQNWEGNAYIIFTDGGNQVPGTGKDGFVIKAGDSKIYKDGNWSDYSVRKPPVVSSSNEDCEFTDSITLTLSAINCTEATYQIDGNKAVKYTNGDKITIGEDAKNGDKITVKLYGSNGEDTVKETYTYTCVKVITETSKIYFKRPNGWGKTIKAYIYSTDTGERREVASYPGVTMASKVTNIYTYTLKDWEGDCYVIFTDGTRKLPATGNGYLLESGSTKLYNSGSWTDYTIKDQILTSSKNSCEFTDSLTLTLSATNCIASSYFINDNAAVVYKSGDKITIGKNAKPGDKITVRLAGNNGETIVNKTYTYTKKADTSNKSTIYFRKPSGWKKTIKAYIYSTDTGERREVAAFPGVTMTSKVTNIYTYTLKDWEGDCYVIFTDGTRKLPATGNGYLLKSGSTKLYNSGSWSDYTIKDQILTSSKNSCEFTDSLTLTLSATNCIASSYFINDNAAVVYKSGDKITIGKDAKPGDKITVRLAGNNGETIVNKTYTYTKKADTNNKSTIYFRKPSGWKKTIKAYIYSTDTGERREVAAFPGVTMTSKVTNIYTYTLNDWEGDCYVIFTDGTRKLPATGNGYLLKSGSTKLYNSGSWSDYTVKNQVLSSSKNSCKFTGSLTLTLSTSNCIASSYFINDKAAVVYKDGDKITIGKDAKVGDKITIKLAGNNGESIVYKTYTYTKQG